VNDIYTVYLSKQAIRDLKKIPVHMALKLQSWIDEVISSGLNETRKINGYHDESLRGNRIGQRSIRINKAYRAIYIIKEDCSVEILEVTKHEY
jgi:proteic killer suppression protein